MKFPGVPWASIFPLPLLSYKLVVRIKRGKKNHVYVILSFSEEGWDKNARELNVRSVYHLVSCI